MNTYLTSNAEIEEKIAESVKQTVVLEQILGIAIVALILTLLELTSIIYIVFPSIKEQIITMLSNQASDSQSTKPIKPLVQTLAKREIGFTARANKYIELVAWGFALLLFFICILLVFLINNEYRLRGKTSAPHGKFLWILFWALLSTVGIGIFQGFGCIVLGQSSMFCSMNSFAVVSTEWKQNDNLSDIALSTGICDGVADTGSFTTEDDFDKVLALHLAQQFAAGASGKEAQEEATEQILRQITTSDETYQTLNEASQRLRRS